MAITDLELSFTPVAGGAFPDGYASRMAGGLHIAASTTARNATPSYRLVQGMLCWVTADGGSLWRLKASPWTGVDGDWEAAGESALFVRSAIVADDFTLTSGHYDYTATVTANKYLTVFVMGNSIWNVNLAPASTASGHEVVVENDANSNYEIRVVGSFLPAVGAGFITIQPGNTARFISNGINDWAIMEASKLVVPVPAGIQGAVIIESDALGTRVARHLYQQDISPDFAISGVSLASTGRLNGVLARRGDVLDTNVFGATYVSGPPTGGSLAESFANGAVSDGGIWSIGGPFSSGSRTGTVHADGVSGNPDPSWTVTITASLAGFSNRVSPITVFWASDVYWGSTTATDLTLGTQVYDNGLIGSFQDSLQRGRNQLRSFSGAGRYDWFLYPNEAAYTNGTPTFRDQSNLQFFTTDMGTIDITRNGVLRTYRKIRSAGLLTAPYDVTVT